MVADDNKGAVTLCLFPSHILRLDIAVNSFPGKREETADKLIFSVSYHAQTQGISISEFCKIFLSPYEKYPFII